MRVDGMPRGDIKEFFRREEADTRGAEWPTDMRPVDVVFDRHVSSQCNAHTDGLAMV